MLQLKIGGLKGENVRFNKKSAKANKAFDSTAGQVH